MSRVRQMLHRERCVAAVFQSALFVALIVVWLGTDTIEAAFADFMGRPAVVAAR